MKKTIWVIIILILLLSGGAFYWFGYRPSAIKKSCAEAVKTSASKYDLDNAFGYLDKRNEDKYYSNCLRLRGL